MGMHSRLSELFEFLDQRHVELLAAIALVSPAKHDESPQPGAWSVAEIVEHLGLIERRLTQLFGKLISEARMRDTPAEQETSSILRAFDASRFVDRTRKIVTAEATRPAGAMKVDAGIRALEEARKELKNTVLQGDGLALGTLTHTHPALGTMNLYEWIAFVGAHTVRHTLQIREIERAFSSEAFASRRPSEEL
jgi:uncharacterized damage-inducible protein DinB